MHNTAIPSATPSAIVLEERWQKSLAMFEMWTQIWRDNPSVLARTNQKIRELMMPLEQVRELQMRGRGRLI